jgi:hypothetical protein
MCRQKASDIRQLDPKNSVRMRITSVPFPIERCPKIDTNASDHTVLR